MAKQKSFTIILTVEQFGSSKPAPAPAEQSSQPTREPTTRVAAAKPSGSRPTGSGGSSPTYMRAPAASEQPGPPVPADRWNSLDTHIVTETLLLPGEPWVERLSRQLLSSLEYRFRVQCSSNYYGDGCVTFCRPRDDQFGHYQCSSLGQRICLDGWQGPECDQAKCRPGCHREYGSCSRPDTCDCRPGWTGPRCDECLTHPGCKNGYCIKNWQCNCHPNWGGFLCDQNLNYCGTHQPCKNNGTCHNSVPFGTYRCSCPEGFAGPDCSVKSNETATSAESAGALQWTNQLNAGCLRNQCLNGGTCYEFNTHLSAAGLTEEPNAGPETLGLMSEPIFRCQCAAGFTGDYCQWPDTPSLATLDLMVGLNETLNATAGREQPPVTPMVAFVEIPAPASNPSVSTRPDLDLKHLLSGVMFASVMGVLLAALLLVWCCLVALERNKFSFIQMNIVRGGSPSSRSSATSDESGQLQRLFVAAASLRSVRDKIRRSLRLTSDGQRHIRPETKLSIENVLRPPPYDESHYTDYVSRIALDYSSGERALKLPPALCGDPLPVASSHAETGLIHEKLVTAKGALELKLTSKLSSMMSAPTVASIDAKESGFPSSEPQQQTAASNETEPSVVSGRNDRPNQALAATNAQRHRRQYLCPRHGHLLEAAGHTHRDYTHHREFDTAHHTHLEEDQSKEIVVVHPDQLYHTHHLDYS